MKKKCLRWYEKNEYLKAFMALMADIPIDEQCKIAVEIIIKASKMIDRDYDKIVKEVADFNPKNYKRWYDKNPNIHIAIESLRDLTDEQISEVIKEFTDKILSYQNLDIEGLDIL